MSNVNDRIILVFFFFFFNIHLDEKTIRDEKNRVVFYKLSNIVSSLLIAK